MIINILLVAFAVAAITLAVIALLRIRPITYAKVGGPPKDWVTIGIVDLSTGQQVPGVVECNTREGWIVAFALDESGNAQVVGEELAMVRRSGQFKIVRKK